MPPEKRDIIIAIVASSVFVLLIVTAAFLLFRIYLKKKNNLIMEQERMKTAYDKALLQSQVEIQEQTFNRISYEIHDNIGQALSLVRLNLNTMGSTPDPAKIEATDELMGKAIADLRNLSHHLNTDYIKNVGLTEAVRQLLQTLERTGQYRTTLQEDEWWQEPKEDKLLILYRMIQEVVNNIIRHAGATAIDVVMKGGPCSSVTVSDNGNGFDSLSTGEYGIGLKNMMARAALIQASIDIASQRGSGTTVAIVF